MGSEIIDFTNLPTFAKSHGARALLIELDGRVDRPLVEEDHDLGDEGGGHRFGKGEHLLPQELDDVTVHGLVGHPVLLSLLLDGLGEQEVFQHVGQLTPKL